MKYIEEMKEMYKTASEWAKHQIQDYMYKRQKPVNESYLQELALCEEWEVAEDIIERYKGER